MAEVYLRALAYKNIVIRFYRHERSIPDSSREHSAFCNALDHRQILLALRGLGSGDVHIISQALELSSKIHPRASPNWDFRSSNYCHGPLGHGPSLDDSRRSAILGNEGLVLHLSPNATEIVHRLKSRYGLIRQGSHLSKNDYNGGLLVDEHLGLLGEGLGLIGGICFIDRASL
ncbi:hypothetical protein GW17_00052490 [Ensete ventricosum]|nr:hypothetical protein GW17_00052490 [Ensete ventricosum]